MPFVPSSRYARTDLVNARTADGRTVAVVKLRTLGEPSASPYSVDAQDRVDTLAQRHYGDATRFWHIADANSELEARALVQTGRTINLPEHG